jgi:hypothetical protein
MSSVPLSMMLHRYRSPSQQPEVPVLVWHKPTTERQELLLGTSVCRDVSRAPIDEAQVFEVRKMANLGNAMTMGVTVGRTQNNDVVLVDNSVSRFHAYLQQDLRSGAWRLVDADSKNGTFLDDARVTGAGVALPPRGRLKFGDIELEYLDPGAFSAWIQATFDL